MQASGWCPNSLKTTKTIFGILLLSSCEMAFLDDQKEGARERRRRALYFWNREKYRKWNASSGTHVEGV